LYSQIDEEGNRHILLEDIIDHQQSNSASYWQRRRLHNDEEWR
jgi:hypothetical protein